MSSTSLPQLPASPVTRASELQDSDLAGRVPGSRVAGNTDVRSSLTVVGGGVRSGKSRLGVELALGLGQRRAFVATARAFDDEMRERIDQHQRERGEAFTTVEAPHRLAEAAEKMPRYDVILVDCLTLYVSNRLLEMGDVEKLGSGAARELEESTVNDLRIALDELRSKANHLIFVTNEVGMGVVPVSRLGRLFRDVAGRVNQWIAGEANEVWLCALGIPMRIKPSPSSVSLVRDGHLPSHSTSGILP